MKNRKIFLLILVAFLLSGCSIKYDLYINNDLSVNEKVTATEKIKTLKMNTKQDPFVAANSLYTARKKDNINYNFSTYEKDDNIIGIASASFDSLEEYENYFTSDVIKNVNITKKDGYVTLEFNQDVELSDDSSRSLPYNSIEVSINVPFLVTDTNADRMQGDQYIWDIVKDGELKKIKITFNTNETKESKKFDLGLFQVNVKYSVLVIAGFALVISAIVLIVYLNNKKNNKI